MFSDLRFDKATSRYTFDIHGVDLAIVNGIRRTLLSSIPVLGFKFDEHNPSITIHNNTGRLHNEFLAHRLSLIPLHFHETVLEAFQDDDYAFQLKVRNDTHSNMDVTTQHFTGSYRGEPLSTDQLRSIFPCNPVSKDPVLITRLRPKEELDVTAVPVLSVANEHAAFMPVSLSTFSYLPDPSDGPRGSALDIERGYARNAFGDPVAFRFQLEPVTGLRAYYLVSKSLEILIGKAVFTRTEMFQAASSKVVLEANEQGGADLTLKGEDDTLGSLIQSLMFNHYVRGHARTDEGRDVTFVAYFAPHPLQRCVVIRAMLGEGGVTCKGLPLREYRDFFAGGLDLVVSELRGVLDAWRGFAKEQ